ncbi:hypothetical protein EDD36DRAFT_421744 [Exophiala viscosa]|uniref:Uncharacterized protein n=1 Tax=Exophiala viscosa TaxID=2486360 RepID=A0AAN6IAX1_9EURO|nr:hypothetical protein EDD36DRAFT_421744 [Exophiala viscosa]
MASYTLASHTSSWSSIVVIPPTSTADARFRHAGETDSSASPSSYEEISPILDERRDERPWTQLIECVVGQSTLSDHTPDDNHVKELQAARHTTRATSQARSLRVKRHGQADLARVEDTDFTTADNDRTGDDVVVEDYVWVI